VRPLASSCATGVGLGATVSVDLCYRSGLEYLSHGFQTQGTMRQYVLEKSEGASLIATPARPLEGLSSSSSSELASESHSTK
jgi:hypothetical protein